MARHVASLFPPVQHSSSVLSAASLPSLAWKLPKPVSANPAAASKRRAILLFVAGCASARPEGRQAVFMRWAFALLLMVLSLAALPFESLSSGPDISYSSDALVRGDLILLRVRGVESDNVQAVWMDKEIPLVHNPDGGLWYGFLAADLNQKPGVYPVAVRVPSRGLERYFDIRVNDRDYGVRKIRLPRAMVELDEASLQRVKREAQAVNTLWDAGCRHPEWEGSFRMPVDHKIVGPFGQKSIINKRKRSPHTGVDIRGKTGAPVRAANSGSVVLVADHFFTGKSVYVDHGSCIFSMYFHLDSIQVDEGAPIEKGQILGRVGATGRATGPHLHWGVRVNSTRVNPLTLIELSRELDP